MRLCLYFLMLVLPIQAEKVIFDKDHSVTFPEGWKKEDSPDKKAVFSRVQVKSGESKISFFLVAVDCKDRVFILQTTLPENASPQSRVDCRNIVLSFQQEK